MPICRTQTSFFLYAVVLGEKKGKRKLPIIIGSFEAQAIAIELEKMKPARPLTHDLLLNFARTMGAELKEVLITDLKEGVYFANLIWIKAEEPGREWVLDARTSDAIALAVRFACPIYTLESVLTQGGIQPEEWEAAFESEGGKSPASALPEDSERSGSAPSAPNRVSMRALEQDLKEALDAEDYEKAARIRDLIEHRRKDLNE